MSVLSGFSQEFELAVLDVLPSLLEKVYGLPSRRIYVGNLDFLYQGASSLETEQQADTSILDSTRLKDVEVQEALHSIAIEMKELIFMFESAEDLFRKGIKSKADDTKDSFYLIETYKFLSSVYKRLFPEMLKKNPSLLPGQVSVSHMHDWAIDNACEFELIANPREIFNLHKNEVLKFVNEVNSSYSALPEHFQAELSNSTMISLLSVWGIERLQRIWHASPFIRSRLKVENLGGKSVGEHLFHPAYWKQVTQRSSEGAVELRLVGFLTLVHDFAQQMLNTPKYEAVYELQAVLYYQQKDWFN